MAPPIFKPNFESRLVSSRRAHHRLGRDRAKISSFLIENDSFMLKSYPKRQNSGRVSTTLKAWRRVVACLDYSKGGPRTRCCLPAGRRHGPDETGSFIPNRSRSRGLGFGQQLSVSSSASPSIPTNLRWIGEGRPLSA